MSILRKFVSIYEKKQIVPKKTLIIFLNLFLEIWNSQLRINKPLKNTRFKISIYFSDSIGSNSFFGPVLILEVPFAAETKKKKPIIPDIPNIAAKGSKEKENIEFTKSK